MEVFSSRMFVMIPIVKKFHNFIVHEWFVNDYNYKIRKLNARRVKDMPQKHFYVQDFLA